MIFYDGHVINFDDRALNILQSHHIQYFILNAGDSIHDKKNDNDPNLKLKNIYGNERMNCTRKHRTLKFMPAHMDDILVKK